VEFAITGPIGTATIGTLQEQITCNSMLRPA
jgi:hypothetical protein